MTFNIVQNTCVRVYYIMSRTRVYYIEIFDFELKILLTYKQLLDFELKN